MVLCQWPRGRTFSITLAAIILITTCPLAGCTQDDSGSSATPSPTSSPSAIPAPPPTPVAAAPAQPGPAPGAATAQQLQELVSPIALYPDVLVAQILAGSTYPAQVVEADRWLKANPNLTGDQLAASVNAQPWDPSIKSLTQFPSVLQTMNDSLAWTSALGEAYYNQPADVMNAIQTLRNMALNAGTLKSTPQQTVEVQPASAAAQSGEQPSVQQTVIIQPAQPSTVYVPQYNPTAVYGAPVQAPPGYSGTDLLLAGVVSFGVGLLVGSLINDGHNNWGCNWGGGSSSSVVYNKNIYVSNNNVLPARYPNGGYPNGGYPNNGYPRPGYPPNNGYPRPGHPPNGGYPRPGNPAQPMPYPGGRPPYNGAVPTTRPYNTANARPYEGGNGKLAMPSFPKAEALPGNPAGANKPTRPGQRKQSGQPANPIASTGPAAAKPSNRAPTNPVRPPANRANDPARGYANDAGNRGGRNAIGGYEPGGSAQAASGRGRASLNGNRNPPGGQRGAGGGGNGGRGQGGGKGRGNGGGGKGGGRRGQ